MDGEDNQPSDGHTTGPPPAALAAPERASSSLIDVIRTCTSASLPAAFTADHATPRVQSFLQDPQPTRASSGFHIARPLDRVTRPVGLFPFPQSARNHGRLRSALLNLATPVAALFLATCLHPAGWLDADIPGSTGTDVDNLPPTSIPNRVISRATSCVTRLTADSYVT